MFILFWINCQMCTQTHTRTRNSGNRGTNNIKSMPNTTEQQHHRTHTSYNSIRTLIYRIMYGAITKNKCFPVCLCSTRSKCLPLHYASAATAIWHPLYLKMCMHVMSCSVCHADLYRIMHNGMTTKYVENLHLRHKHASGDNFVCLLKTMNDSSFIDVSMYCICIQCTTLFCTYECVCVCV